MHLRHFFQLAFSATLLLVGACFETSNPCPAGTEPLPREDRCVPSSGGPDHKPDGSTGGTNDAGREADAEVEMEEDGDAEVEMEDGGPDGDDLDAGHDAGEVVEPPLPDAGTDGGGGIDASMGCTEGLCGPHGSCVET